MPTKAWEVCELNFVRALRCRECGKEYPPTFRYVCEECFGPLEVVYDYSSVHLEPNAFAERPRTIWRYRELLPIDEASQIIDLGVGYTPLRRATRLGSILGVKELHVKDDTVNPSGSFKDRPAAVAVTKALEFKAAAVGCASTGNLAAAVAAHAAKAGLPCYVFIPAGTESAKIVQASSYGARIVAVQGTYDDANRLAAEAAERYGWAFANINIRPYYVEGSKTLALETCEQLGWTTPERAIIPVGSGALLCAIDRGFRELVKIGLIEHGKVRITGAQAEGCSPVVSAFKNDAREILPVEKPDTVAKSLAIGDPGDGLHAAQTIRRTGGLAEAVSDWEIVDAIRLLAKTEGIFAEPAGAVTIAALRKGLESGEISPDERIVCYVTGSGLKAPDCLLSSLPQPVDVQPRLDALEAAHLEVQ